MHPVTTDFACCYADKAEANLVAKTMAVIFYSGTGKKVVGQVISLPIRTKTWVGNCPYRLFRQ